VNNKANCEVAAALFMLNLYKIIRDGTKIIPPPIPKQLDIIPAKNEKRTSKNNLP
jgi:hypothetical protein